MSYIGNEPISAAFLTDTFSGDGSTTVFTMTVAPANTSSIIVAVTGVLQDPSTYSVSGTTLTFSGAPPSGTGNISVRYLGIPASGVTTTAYRTVTEFTATAGQTVFSVPSYVAGFVDVYRNGVMLGSADYTATSGTTIVLASGATAGDLVEVISFYVSSVLNAIPATSGSVTDSYISTVSASKLTGTQTIPKGTLPTGAVLQVLQTTTSTNTATTSTSYADATNLTVTITPSSATSKVLVTCDLACYIQADNVTVGGVRIVRDGTAIYTDDRYMFDSVNANVGFGMHGPFIYLDSPATTSAVVYKIQIKRTTSAGTSYAFQINGQSGNTSSITLMEIAA
jgi:hypothetical protein